MQSTTDVFNLIDFVNEKLQQNEAFKQQVLGSKRLFEWLVFRGGCVIGENVELNEAIVEKDIVEAMDAFVDMGLFALGTLVMALGPDAAREMIIRTLNANGTKSPGFKPERQNKFSMPDMIKGPEFVPAVIDDLVPEQLKQI